MTASPIPSEPRQRALPIWRGDDDPGVVWPFAQTEAPGSFDNADFLLIVQWGARGGPAAARGEFTRLASMGALVVDRAALTVAWAPTVEDFAVITRGAAIQYELKRIVAGRVRTLAWGEVRIGSGLFRDPTEDTSPAGQGYVDIRIAALRSELRAEIAKIEPGQGGGARVETQAAASVTLGGHKAVRGTLAGLAYASAAYASHTGTVLGVTTGAAAAQADATIVSAGPIDEPSWSWAPGPVWLGFDGNLTQTPPAGAFVQQIGVAVGPTRLIVSLGPPIRTL